MAKLTKLDDIVSLCKRRGFIFQSSEIYGGLASCYDYGPLGVELKRNVREAWWKDVVRMRDDVVGLDCSILMHPLVWKASGHVDNFTDSDVLFYEFEVVIAVILAVVLSYMVMVVHYIMNLQKHSHYKNIQIKRLV